MLEQKDTATHFEPAGTRGKLYGVINAPEQFDVAELLPVQRLRWLNKLTPRFFIPVYAGTHSTLSLFLDKLTRDFAALDYYLLDANLWTDGGKGRATDYHNDLWFTAPLQNNVLQLWIPLVCEGETQEISNSMLRLDGNALPEKWGCAVGNQEYVHLWSGERQAFTFPHYKGRLSEDLPSSLAGKSLRVGDVLYFDNAFCHYTLPSKAYRIALALRFSFGEPTYNGYFDTPKPLDGNTSTEFNRKLMQAVFEGVKAGEKVPFEKLFRRADGTLFDRVTSIFNFFMFLKMGNKRLLPAHEQFASTIVNQVTQAYATHQDSANAA